MKKRLRKKKHRGEFRELGFSVRFRFKPGLSNDERNGMLGRWIREAIEAQGLLFGGGGLDEWEGFVTPEGRGSATEAQREAVRSWLGSCAQVAEPEVGPLVDAWYGKHLQ